MSEPKDLQPPSPDASHAPARVEEVRSRARYPGYYGAPVDDVDDSDDQLPLYRYWLLLLRHKGTLILAGVLGALAGFLFSLPQTPIYEAAATVEIQGLNEGFLGMRDVNPMEQGQGVARMDLSTQVEIIQSRSVVSKAQADVEESAPADSKLPAGRLSAWRRALGFEDESPATRRSQAIAMAAMSLRAVPTRDSRIVRVSTESTDPSLAATFVNSLAKRFIEESVEARWEATQYTEDWLERQLEELRIKLEDAEDRLQGAANASGIVFTSDTTNAAQEQLQRLQSSVAEARADRIAKQSRFELATNSPSQSLPDILDRPSLAQYQTQLTELRQALANLLATYTESYPQVKQLKAQIAEVERAQVRESQNVVSRIQNDYQEALRRENLLQSDYDNQAKLVSEQSRRGIQYNILKREVETTRQLYDNLLQKGKEARLAAAMNASPVRVVDEAVPPMLPTKPNHSRNSMMGLLLGAVLGAAFVIGREKIDRTIKNPGDAEFYLTSPELGFIPMIDETASTGRKVRLHLMRKSSSGSRKTGAKTGKADANKRIDGSSTADGDSGDTELVRGHSGGHDLDKPGQTDLVTWNQPQSWAAECFQATLTSILFSGQNGDVPRKLVVTSASPGEGKSTVVSNLAVALAETNHSVLVIDADMRRPRQHEIFALRNEQGLSDLLRHPVEIDSDLLGVVAKQTHVPGVMLLPSGPGARNVSNLLYSDRARELLKVARQRFDWVLIDTPPMSQLSDARLLGRLAGAVVLVIKAGSTTRDATAICEERLRKDGTRVLGTVLNRWQPTTSDPGYYKYKNYYAHHDYYSHTDRA